MKKGTDLDGTSVDHSLLPVETLRNSIFCNHRFSCTSMRRNKYTFIALYSIDGNLLERIEFKFIFSIRFERWHMLRKWGVAITRRNSYLMSDLNASTIVACQRFKIVRVFGFEALRRSGIRGHLCHDVICDILECYPVISTAGNKL